MQHPGHLNRLSSKTLASKLNQLRPKPKTEAQPESSKLDKEHILKMIEMWEAEHNEPFQTEQDNEVTEEGLQEVNDDEDTPVESEIVNDVRERQRLIELEIRQRRLAESQALKKQRMAQITTKKETRKNNSFSRAKPTETEALAVRQEVSEEEAINRWVSLIIWIVGLEAIGFAIGNVSGGASQEWFKHINKSPLEPPGWVFGVAWTILYGLIAIAGWTLQHSKQTAQVVLMKNLYWFQMILNWSWSFVFFAYKEFGLSLLIIIVMVVSVAAIIYTASGSVKTVGYLLLPYLLWLSFATYLNYYIWSNNPNPIHGDASNVVAGEGMRYTHQTQQTWTSPNGDYRKVMEEYSKLL